MATKRKPGSRPGLIHCDKCGEDYSDTYKSCPFCEEYEEEYEYEYEDDGDRERPPRRSGGKRLASSNRRGGGYRKTSPVQIAMVVISLVVILAAIWIVVTKLAPMISRGDVDTIDPNTSQSLTPSPDSAVSSEPSVDPSPDAGGQSTEDPVASPSSDPGTSIVDATGFSLSKQDVTLEYQGQEWTPGVTFIPEGSSVQLTWASDNEAVATVSSDGTITAVGVGTTTVSAMMPNGVTHACIVRCKWTSNSSSSTGGGTASGSYTVNNPDFTFYRVGETYTLKVNNYSGSVSWSSSNTSVATVSSGGTCTAVGNGTCTVTGTLDNGSTVEAIVRVKIS